LSLVQYYGTGRRKTSTARVFLRPGTGNIRVNSRPFETHFYDELHRMIIQQPLQVCESLDKFDILINVKGGGVSGQAGAVRHGLARALVQASAEFRPALKKAGFLTRDPRMVERKKYGQPGARKRFQFSKR
jgi:small subunit ribosomal protein S9